MRLVLEAESRARLEMEGDGFEIVSESAPISPYHLLAGSLASCTALTLGSWAESGGIDMTPLSIHVAWANVEGRPKRIERVEMELRWPGLPEERVETAGRVADLCPIHATLRRAAEVDRRIVALPAHGGA
jgi:uncharacterized OsmC-like protein